MTIIGDILRAIGRDALREIRPRIGSTTLREALRLIVNESEARADLFIPHYWAEFYHDGRAGFSVGPGKYLVFFDRAQDDPRLVNGQYPERRSELRRLTREEFKRGLKINNLRRANGGRPFMYVVQQVRRQRPRPFFDDFARGHAERAGPEIARLFDQHIQRLVDSDPRLRPEKKTARINLPRVL